MSRGLVTVIVTLVGCAANDDVVGPFTGTTYHFALDRIQLPATNDEVRDLGGDLSGDGYFDNSLGYAIRLLDDQGDVTRHSAEMIAGGAVPTLLEMIADDPVEDSSVGVTYLGAPDAAFTIVGGRLRDGWFRSNPTATSEVPGAAELVLPIFQDADPSRVPAIGLELNLVPDGAGGFSADVHAAIPEGRYLLDAVALGFNQMIAFDPGQHRQALQLLDAWPQDGVITAEDLTNNSLVAPMLWPDVTILGTKTKATSIGFRAHFTACPDGRCPPAPAFDTCFDRVRDGDESDVDCGGSCRGCEQYGRCATAADCRTVTCDQGACGPPSCSDGILNGFESDVDCGGMNPRNKTGGCAPCSVGKRCYFWIDCTPGSYCKCTDDNGQPCDKYTVRAGVCAPSP